MKVSFLHGVNFLLVVTDREACVPELHVACSCKGSSLQLNGIFLNRDDRRMLEKKDYFAVDIVISIMGSCIDHPTGFQNDANIKKVRRMYFDTVSKVVLQNYGC